MLSKRGEIDLIVIIDFCLSDFLVTFGLFRKKRCGFKGGRVRNIGNFKSNEK